MNIDIQPLKDFEAAFSRVMDTLEQLKRLEVPAESEGAIGIERWFREFRQTLLTLPTDIDATHLSRFAEEVEAALAAGVKVGPGPKPALEARMLPTPRGFWAEIVSETGSGAYTFKEIRRKDGTTWEDLEGGRTGTAYEVNNELAALAGEIIRMAVEHDTGGNLRYVFCLSDTRESCWVQVGEHQGGGSYLVTDPWRGLYEGLAWEINLTEDVPVGTDVRLFKDTMFDPGAYAFEYSTWEDLLGVEQIVGGPGITVDATDPAAPVISVDLAAANVRGLQFIGAGNAAQLAVLADGAEGIKVDAEGVGIRINDGVDGLRFDEGVLKTKPDNTRALAVDGDGLYVMVPAAGDRKGVIYVPGGGGLGAHVNLTAGVGVDDDGLYAILNNEKGLLSDTNGIYIVLDTTNLEFANGAVKHKQQVENVTKIAIWMAEGALVTRVWKGGIEIDGSPGDNVIVEWDDAGHTDDAGIG